MQYLPLKAKKKKKKANGSYMYLIFERECLCVLNLSQALASRSQRPNLLQALFADIALEVDERARGESRLCFRGRSHIDIALELFVDSNS